MLIITQGRRLAQLIQPQGQLPTVGLLLLRGDGFVTNADNLFMEVFTPAGHI